MTTKPRRLTYDLEFVEDGHSIELVSIGVVRVDALPPRSAPATATGPDVEYYAINADISIERLTSRPWLAENVLPHLPTFTREQRYMSQRRTDIDRREPYVKPRRQIAAEVAKFLLDTPGDGSLELWADCGAYDHVCLCWTCWGPMAKKPAAIPDRTNEIRQYAEHLGVPLLNPPVGRGVKHRAIDDARTVAWQLRRLDEQARSGRIPASVVHDMPVAGITPVAAQVSRGPGSRWTNRL